MVIAWHGRGTASVNQTRPHCVNQMGNTRSKPLAARHSKGTAWAWHAIRESAFRPTLPDLASRPSCAGEKMGIHQEMIPPPLQKKAVNANIPAEGRLNKNRRAQIKKWRKMAKGFKVQERKTRAGCTSKSYSVH
jgi:hypothetical protein